MKVIAAINGTITAETMAFYALKYAQVQNKILVLLHIENDKDNIEDVKLSMDRITMLAASHKVQIEHIILNGSIPKCIVKYLSEIFVDIIFCSTRKNNRFILNSFSEILTKMNLNIDIAVVRIVKISHIMDVKNMVLSIKDDKLSVKKFTFFATLASAYKADTEIYSVSSMSKFKLSRIDTHEVRERLALINYNLRHYLKLAHLMPFNIHIKHSFSQNEERSLLSHIAKSNTELVVIGAKRLSIGSFFSSDVPIEILMREASINTIAYYPKED